MPVTMFITIDTEEDSWNLWVTRDACVNNVNHLIMLQELFNKHGAVPTYLVTYPIATTIQSKKIVKKLLDKGQCEIGMHCHPWNTPPFEETISPYNSMLCNLSNNLIKRKMETLHNRIKNSFGVVPKSFRAGRWAFGPSVARCLVDMGYKIDTSITPLCDWKSDGGPDFFAAPNSPYCFHPENILIKNSFGSLIEVPPTIGFLQKNYIICAKIRKLLSSRPCSSLHLVGLFNRMRWLNFRWLSPELSSAKGMIQLAKTSIALGHQVLNMCFHSTSLSPGSSPFVKNNHDLNDFVKKIDAFLSFANENNICFAPLSSFDSLCKDSNDF